MRKPSLEQYLLSDLSRSVHDHALRASQGADGLVEFYVHPALVDGVTPQFVVVGNALVQLDSDRELTGLSFSAALEFLKRGRRVLRSGWDQGALGMAFAYLQPGSVHGPDLGFPIGAEPGVDHASTMDGISLGLFATDGDAGTAPRLPTLCLHQPHGTTLTGWLPRMDDLLATDWRVLPALAKGQADDAGFVAE